MRKAAFLTLGCKVNFYETEKMMEQLRDHGFEIVDFSEPADIYIVNTCTVTNIADRKSRQMLHRAKKKNPDSLVAAVGCYVESGGERLKDDSLVDACFTNADKEHLAERLLERLAPGATVVAPVGVPAPAAGAGGDIRPLRTRAYIKVQDGCNQFCSYCAIPYARGRGKLRSMPEEQVCAEVEKRAAAGCREIVLTGIHLSSYGVDLSGESDFVKLGGKPLLSLIYRVAEVPGIRRIRLGSLEPRIMTGSFVEGLSGADKLCPHFHLSLQSGCDAVLGRMNRRYTTAEYREKADLLRSYFDDPALTTDIITGFPGETDGEFEATRGYLREIGFADIHVFPFSPRSGTKAAGMPGQVRPETKKRRAEILNADKETYRLAYRRRFLGKREKVLFEETAEQDGRRYLTGHNERYVKIGVPLAIAGEKGYRENEIREVEAGYIF